MNFFRKKEQTKEPEKAAAVSVQTAAETPAFSGLLHYAPAENGMLSLYTKLRQSVPIVDAALDKIVRLIGEFTVTCEDPKIERELRAFLQDVKVGPFGCGALTFLQSFLDDLLTYGNAVGEMVVANGQIAALYNASLSDVEFSMTTPLDWQVRRRTLSGSEPVPYPALVLSSARRPEPGSARGRSLLEGLPFMGDILLKIYHTIGKNWDRAGNVRFAVTVKPDQNAAAFAPQYAQQVAEEWGRAMKSERVSDFVAVGDVSIRAIGADGQILDSEVPVRQMLEQIVAKLGLPPFLLGLSWSSTERMSSQQADVLTSELESYRRLLDPILYKLCRTWMALSGEICAFSIDWNDITLQDTTELAAAALNRAREKLALAQAAAVKVSPADGK